ncbi:YbfB/YjiJ family MFS transporter [Nocardia sp. NBC_00565]|uniref:YbfB/YjiJ family MFS transporter n=1 Tax=Nocardia sp. NBC_00565 TaxID=2975993 RepID=UPI002E81E001|nr:YbfB/YjiJ family MFS transporter [Nocardia sp. NBC_00565]WUC07085.1 YbfB/YjiJ family MFS transporter [Nocardia sp. NBC_00565]
MTASALLDTARRTLAPALAAGAGLAGAMGVGRFAYTPLLPAMVDAHRIDAHDGALIAAANYAGYLAGAVLLTRRPNLNSRTAFRVSAGILVVSEALVALPGPIVLPALLRLIAGLASAVLFVGCAGAIARLGGQGHGAGIAFGGVGFGIALTGLAALAARPVLPWQGLWLGAAGLTAVLLLPALRLDIHPGRHSTGVVALAKRSSTAWRALLIAYTLEGVGYIVIGTFLVAAVGAHNAALGSAMWVIVGVAAAPAVLWSMAARRWTPTTAMVLALLAQCAAAALLAGSTTTWPAIVAAALFGGTFMGITMLAIRLGTELTDHRAAATLTAGYGAGQMLGPLLVAPVIGDGYAVAFGIATVVLAMATAAAVVVARDGQLKRT